MFSGSPVSASQLRQRGERLVAAIELARQDVGELLRHRARFGLVGLDLDALRQELGHPVPLLGLLAEVALGA